jgi:urea transport system permease protein
VCSSDLGGRGTLIGAIVGALLVNYAKTKFTAIMPDGWLFALGALFVFVTLYLPQGLMGLYKKMMDKRKNTTEGGSGPDDALSAPVQSTAKGGDA